MEFTPDQIQLIENHMYLPKRLAAIWFHRYTNSCIEYDDLYQAGCIGLCMAAIRYDPSRNAAFKTYASTAIQNAMRDHLRSVMLPISTVTLETPLPENPDLTYNDILEAPDSLHPFTALETQQLWTQLREQYSGTARKGIDALYLKQIGYKNTEIAKMFGVSSNYLAACISRSLSVLRKNEQLKELYA